MTSSNNPAANPVGSDIVITRVFDAPRELQSGVTESMDRLAELVQAHT